MPIHDKKYTFFYLKSCDTCLKILKQLPQNKLNLVNIKEYPLKAEQLEYLHSFSHSYESLFNFRAQKLKLLTAQEKPVGEEDFKKYLLEDYTYLKRPVILVEDKIFIGNSPQNIEQLKIELLANE